MLESRHDEQPHDEIVGILVAALAIAACNDKHPSVTGFTDTRSA